MSKNKKYVRRRRIALTVSIIIVIFFVYMIITYIANLDKSNNGNNEYSKIDNSSSKIEDMSSSEPEKIELSNQEKKQYVLEHPDEYTEQLIKFMDKYDQVIDYVYNYKDRDSIDVSLNEYEYKTETAFPLYIQWDARWGYVEYGDSLIGLSGCGPTSLAMVYEGLTGNSDQTPATICELSENNEYYIFGVGTSWDLMTKGANDLGLKSQALSLYENSLIEELQQGRPIICSVRKGDFTTSGHFIVIAGYKNGKFIVNDPNSKENSSKLWDYDVLEPQIKNLWSFWI